MNELSLFTGAFGGGLGSRLLGWRTICAVEIDPYCREVVLRRQEEKILEPFPIWDDIRTFDGTAWRGKVDIISAGFPCQPFSVAGKRAGEGDERNMWPDTVRIIREVRPACCLLENVAGLLSAQVGDASDGTLHYYFGTILRDLAESGYDAEWRLLSASECGAPHKRTRLWVVAYALETGARSEGRATGDERRTAGTEGRESIRQGNGAVGSSGVNSASEDVADTENDNGGSRKRRTEEATRPEGQRRRRPTGRGQNVADASGTRRTKRESKPGDDEQEQPTAERGRCEWWVSDPADISYAGCEHGNRQPNAETGNRDSDGQGLADGQKEKCPAERCGGKGSAQPRLGRVAHGVANRVDRLKAIGNGQVPEVVRTAWELLTANR